MAAQSRTGADLEPRVIRAAFDALDRGGIDWVLLREMDQLSAARGDVDLLVAPSAAARLDGTLASSGFARLPARGHGSHRFYLHYDGDDDAWTCLDVVTEVAFGRFQEFATESAETLLARRQRFGSVAGLAPADAFWHLLLHELLGAGDVRVGRRDVLRSLAPHASLASPLAELAADIDAESVRALPAAVGDGAWDAVRGLGAELRRAWRRTRRAEVLNRIVKHRLARRLPAAAPDGKGVSVAVLGPDGAGKTTLADGIRRTIPIPARYVYLGIWRETPLEQRLHRIVGARLTVRLVRLLSKSVLIRYHRRQGRVILLDRFTCDADLPAPDADWKSRVSAQLVRRTCADPDVMILLDAPVELMFARKGEHGVRELQLRRSGYHAMADRFPQMVVLDAAEPAEDVRRRATALLWERWSRPAAARNGGPR